MESRGSNQQPKASCVAQTRNSTGSGRTEEGLGGRGTKDGGGRGTEEGLERDRPKSCCKPWGYSQICWLGEIKAEETQTPTHPPTPIQPHTDSPRPLESWGPQGAQGIVFLLPICVRAWRPIIDHRLQGWGAGTGARVSRCPWQPLPKLREGSCLYLCVSVPDLTHVGKSFRPANLRSACCLWGVKELCRSLNWL